MVRDIKEVLKEMGWSDGFRVPIANQENKVLEEELDRKVRHKAQLTIELERYNEKLGNIKNHIEALNNAHSENQSIINAHRNQITTEDHLYRVANHEESRLRQEIRRITNTLSELAEKKHNLNGQIVKNREEFEKLKNDADWDKSALLNWEENLARSEEDNELIMKYIEQDESKFKELELERRRYQTEVEERKKNLDKLTLDVSTIETSLEKTGYIYRELHDQRQILVKHWEEAVKVLHLRDQAIHVSHDEIAMFRSIASEKNEQIKEMHDFIERQKEDNREIELNNQESEKNLFKLKQEYKNLEQINLDIAAELITLKKLIYGYGQREDNSRLRNKAKLKEINKLENKIEQLQELTKELTHAYESIQSNSSSEEEKFRKMEEMIKQEERSLETTTYEIQRIAQIHYNTEIQNKVLMDQIKVIENEEKACRVENENLKGQIKEIETRIWLEKQKVYNSELAAEKTQRKINHLIGEISIGEKLQIRDMLRELEEVFASKKQQLEFMILQNKRLNDEMRRVTTRMAKDQVHLDRLTVRKDSRLIEIEAQNKLLRECETNFRERQVEENLLELQLSHLNKLNEKEGNQLFDLKKHRFELDKALKERLLEINIRLDMLVIKKRSLEEEVSHLRHMIQHLETKCRQLQGQYEIAIDTIGKSDDGAELSVGYFTIKNAQESALLQQQGDELDGYINQAEKEIYAMENTLKVLNSANDSYRNTLDEITENSPEFQKMKDLETQLGAALDKAKIWRQNLITIEKEVESLSNKLKNLSEGELELRMKWATTNETAEELDRELGEQEEKLDRAKGVLKHAIKQIRPAAQSKTPTLYELELDVREIIEQKDSALQLLAELAARMAETQPVITQYLAEHNFKLPDVDIPSFAVKKSPFTCSYSSSVMGTTSMVGGSGASTRSDTSGTDASVSVINIHDYPQPKPRVCDCESPKSICSSRSSTPSIVNIGDLPIPKRATLCGELVRGQDMKSKKKKETKKDSKSTEEKDKNK